MEDRLAVSRLFVWGVVTVLLPQDLEWWGGMLTHPSTYLICYVCSNCVLVIRPGGEEIHARAGEGGTSQFISHVFAAAIRAGSSVHPARCQVTVVGCLVAG